MFKELIGPEVQQAENHAALTLRQHRVATLKQLSSPKPCTRQVRMC